MVILFLVLAVSAICVKRPNIFPLLIIIFLVGLNYNALNVSDFWNYNAVYNNIAPNRLFQTGYGWYLLNNIGRNLGLNYNQYKAYSIAICLAFIWLIIYMLGGKKQNIVFGLYLFYPALIDTIQIRFFTAMTIVMIGILFLRKRKLWSSILFVCIVLIASTVHSSMLFYLILVLYPLLCRYINQLKYVIIVLTLIFIVFKNKLYDFVAFFSNDRQLQYFDPSSEVTSGSGFLIIIALFSIVLVYFFNQKFYQIIINDSLYSKNDKNSASVIYGISLMMFLLSPLIFLSGEFFRVFRISFIFSYILISILLKRYKTYSISVLNYNGKKISLSIRLIGTLIAIISFILNILYLTPAAFSSYF